MNTFGECVKESDNILYPGTVSQFHFDALIFMANIRGGKIKSALNDYLVHGVSRKDVFELYNVSPSFFSIKLKRVRLYNSIVFSIISYY